MTRTILLAAALLAIAPASAQQAALPPPADVSEARLRADVDRLVAFGTRHTLSDYNHRTRGIGAANRWAEAEFRRIGEACGGCLTIQLPEEMVSGNRIPAPTRLVNVLAVQRGTERPDEVVIISAHIDSRASDPLDATSDAPGANDNASGSAAVLEAARVLSRQRFPSTIVYALLSGEEQGLYGGRLLARHAAAQGWTVKAVINNDIIGGSRGSDGVTETEHVRVFSEAGRADATDAYRAAARREGGENDGPSRNLSRFIAGIAAQPGAPINVRQVWRADRFGRGGDQLPMQEAGFPAIRIAVGIEDYDHQHQNVRVEDGVTYGDTVDEMDFAYLARATRLNIAILSALARAPMPPALVVAGAVSASATISWEGNPGAHIYRIYRRRTDERDWALVPADQYELSIITAIFAQEPGAPCPCGSTNFRVLMHGNRIDDWMFGVSAVSFDGHEGPIASAVPGGAYAPLPRPAP
jgi:hypothetical protein